MYRIMRLKVREVRQYSLKAGNLKPLFGMVSTLRKRLGSVKHHHVRRTDRRLARIDGLVNKALDEAGY